MKFNTPNKLTIFRIVLIPFFMVFLLYNIFGGEKEIWCRIISAAIFIIASVTDFLDGYLARKNGQVTNFGKFMDPLADKFLVFGAIIAILASDFAIYDGSIISQEILRQAFLWSGIVVIFRELAVTSMRLVVNNTSGIVVSANMLGKIKTNTQIVCVCCVILEPILLPFCGNLISFISCIVMTVFTIWSGLSYLKAYWPYIKSDS
ncbi:MAG: CDP-diacylglycerol--glycerol-3-phosphate 3-phosphatidyltransferase [Clostridia bacterium]|nr:CDP-diacylglycerol--glycerol-3-phosphate 3-phosphatidyltransferase [Clostridia bacterium]MBO7216647.1 CDP-diacylglycerol--glycerol-3-phosphate 3-phosphatidyltransferase [Clostridia bacterium]MBO7246490.1 CDP-diacylglycerol--glycerol-3-phosphate 3-phosphatidyltransferase [Clostridia bacterium]MBO7738582.1 CDP-diacylglycerol--glycerol-3-phosphate 3-phosphatidyltransferase [Clostridia bacterium]